jgi:lysophospholipid acyltransferase
LLDVVGFSTFMFGFLAGPAVDFHEYMGAIGQYELAEARSRSDKAKSKSISVSLPRPPWSLHLYNLSQVILSCAGLFVSLAYFPADYVTQFQFMEDPRPLALLKICLTVAGFRYRFYLVWSLTDLAAGLAGISYSDESKDWDMFHNTYITHIELAPNVRCSINSWNIRTAQWLNSNVYQRVFQDRSGKPTPLSTAAVFFVSAFWHGVHINYFMFFLSGALHVEAAKAVRRRFFHLMHRRVGADREGAFECFRHWFDGTCSPLAPLYDVLGFLLTFVFLNSAGTAFMILDLQLALKVWSHFYFHAHVLSIAALLLLPMFPAPRGRSKAVGPGSPGSKKESSDKTE